MVSCARSAFSQGDSAYARGRLLGIGTGAYARAWPARETDHEISEASSAKHARRDKGHYNLNALSIDSVPFRSLSLAPMRFILLLRAFFFFDLPARSLFAARGDALIHVRSSMLRLAFSRVTSAQWCALCTFRRALSIFRVCIVFCPRWTQRFCNLKLPT